MKFSARHSLLGFVGALLVSVVSYAQPTVTDVRVARQDTGTRVVLELNQTAQQKIFTLDNPARVVIDLAATTLAGQLPLGEGVVKNLRAGKRDNGDLRIVLDVTQAVQLQTSWLAAEGSNGPRLVLDLTNGVTSQPVAAPIVATDVRLAAQAQPVAVKSVSDQAQDLIIAVDAGHGGQDPGAIGKHGVKEKNVTLAIAKLLKERIDAEPGMRAVLTRDSDVFVPLRERINRARQMQANMFISIHADSVASGAASGSSVYTLSFKGATNEAARFLADRENAADLVGGVSLDDKSGVLASVLLDLTQGASMSASMEAASRVLQQLDRIGSTHHSQVQQAGFVVLKSPDIPSMLVETAFISNPTEEARLNDPSHQGRIADAVFSGVRDYFYTNAPPGTRVAQLRAMRQASIN